MGVFFSFLCRLVSHPPSAHPVLPASWLGASCISHSLALSLSFSTFPFYYRKLTSSSTPSSLMRGCRGSYASTFDLFFMSGCVSASVAWAQNLSWEVVDGACPLSDGCFPSAFGLPTVPFQQAIKSMMDPRKGSAIYRKNNKSCFYIYLLDSVFYKMKLLPRPAWAI